MSYNIAFTADNGYIQHLATAMQSLLENNKDLNLTIYVISEDISNTNADKLQYITKQYDNANLKILLIKDDAFNDFVVVRYLAKSAYHRLLIPDLITDNKVLYLDSDIVVNGSIKDMYDIDLKNNYIGAVKVKFTKLHLKNNYIGNHHELLDLEKGSAYFNSGVMLINNKKWKNDKISERTMAFIADNPDILKKLGCPDQDALNAIIKKNWLSMPVKYNAIPSTFTDKNITLYALYPESDVIEAKKQPVIIHYTGGRKPWHITNRSIHKKLYWHYRNMTPFKRYTPEDLNLTNIMRRMTPKYIKKIIRYFLPYKINTQR